MIGHKTINPVQLERKSRDCEISLGGNLRLKIPGKLNCRSGKKGMKELNRIILNLRAKLFKMDIAHADIAFETSDIKMERWNYSKSRQQ